MASLVFRSIMFRSVSVRKAFNNPPLLRLIHISCGIRPPVILRSKPAPGMVPSPGMVRPPVRFTQPINLSCSRNFSLFGIRLRTVRKRSVFLLGFVSMSILMIMDFVWERYRLSGVGFRDLLSSWNGGSPRPVKISLADSDHNFATKYASIIDESEVPSLHPSRNVAGSITLPEFKLTLFQYQMCPFCSKVRVFLDYYGLPYDVIEVNPVMRQQIKFSKLYRKVPILLVSPTKSKTAEFENETLAAENNINNKILQINDSTLIISALCSYLLAQNPNSAHHGQSLTNIVRWYLNSQVLTNPYEEAEMNRKETFKPKKAQDELINKYFLMVGDVDAQKYEKIDPLLAEDRRWRKWVDDDLVHVLSPNIYRTLDEARNSFRHFAEVSQWHKYFADWEISVIINVGSTVMYYVGKRLKKKYGLKDDVRQSLYDSCNYWLKSIGPDRRFMGGETPSLADLTVFAALSSIECCSAFDDLLKNTKISEWYFPMKSAIEQHRGSNDLFPQLVENNKRR